MTSIGIQRKMGRRGILFVMSGASGVGKGTIHKEVLARVPDIKLSVSATTRPKRPGEVDGREYYFIDPADFEAKIKNNEFLEYAHVYSHMYGTLKSEVDDILKSGIDVLLEIDIQGARQVREKMPHGVFIFIQPPSMEALVERIHGRGQDSLQSIQDRLNACEGEMAMARYYDYIVINDELEEAIKKVQAIINAERCRVKYY